MKIQGGGEARPPCPPASDAHEYVGEFRLRQYDAHEIIVLTVNKVYAVSTFDVQK